MFPEKDFPKPIARIVEALDSDQRRRILIELEDRDLSYSEIKQRTKLGKGTLNYHLRKLLAAGMIRNFLVDQEISDYNSYYEVSELGRNVIEGLLSAFRTPVRRIRLTSTTTQSIDMEILDADRIKEQEKIRPTDAASRNPSYAIIRSASSKGE
jgi:DNA-binding transcriptional ArsR family regulator